MIEPTTLTVELDVHARSAQLAAVRAEELLEERTLPYDEAQGVREIHWRLASRVPFLNSLHRRGHPPQC